MDLSEEPAGLCYRDMDRVRALGLDDIRDEIPRDFSIPITIEEDPVTDNALVIWRESLLIEGQPITFALGHALTREAMTESNGGYRVVRGILGLRNTVLVKEEIRLGCYRLRGKQ